MNFVKNIPEYRFADREEKGELRKNIALDEVLLRGGFGNNSYAIQDTIRKEGFNNPLLQQKSVLNLDVLKKLKQTNNFKTFYKNETASDKLPVFRPSFGYM